MESFLNQCSSLSILPGISRWDTHKVTDMSYMFNACSTLLSFPDLSKWDITNVKNMSYMFYECSSILYIPGISNWNISGKIIRHMLPESSSFIYICK